jgi:hypothetical protein
LFLVFGLFGNDIVAELDTLVADVDGGTGNKFANFVPILSTERTP